MTDQVNPLYNKPYNYRVRFQYKHAMKLHFMQKFLLLLCTKLNGVFKYSRFRVYCHM